MVATRYKSKLLSHLFENAKVASYVAIPIAVVFTFSQPEMMEKIVRNRMYVLYPPENERPPLTVEEARQRAQQSRS